MKNSRFLLTCEFIGMTLSKPPRRHTFDMKFDTILELLNSVTQVWREVVMDNGCAMILFTFGTSATPFSFSLLVNKRSHINHSYHREFQKSTIVHIFGVSTDNTPSLFLQMKKFKNVVYRELVQMMTRYLYISIADECKRPQHTRLRFTTGVHNHCDILELELPKGYDKEIIDTLGA